MIYINRQLDYCLQLLLALADMPKGEWLSLRAFATDRSISFLFLQKIARKLKSAGIVQAQKGPLGGYALALSAKDITLHMVAQALESRAPLQCMHGQCNKQPTCGGQAVLRLLYEDVQNTMQTYTLASIQSYATPQKT